MIDYCGQSIIFIITNANHVLLNSDDLLKKKENLYRKKQC